MSDDVDAASEHSPAPTLRVGLGIDRRAWWMIIACLLLLLAVSILRFMVGTSSFGWPGVEIVKFRLESLGVAAIAGAALALAGVALQGLLRNPLAEPYLLGLSTGAAAGMMLQRVVETQAGRWLGPAEAGALAGALLSMAVVFAIGRRHGVLDPLAILLVGVVVSTINGALVLLMSHFSGPGGVRDDVARWMMGHLSLESGWASRLTVAALTAGGAALLLWKSRAMDVATLGDEEAVALGVRVGRLRVMEFITAGVLAAGAVTLAGPVAFVGLIAPHLGRALVGSGHGVLLIVSGVLGAALLVSADIAGAAVALGSERLGRPVGVVPVGVWTALVGGVAFVAMLRRRVGRGE